MQVEEVLNCKVDTTIGDNASKPSAVEEVLNCKVDTTHLPLLPMIGKVE